MYTVLTQHVRADAKSTSPDDHEPAPARLTTPEEAEAPPLTA